MRYRLFAKSIPGPKYIKKGWVCQDSSGTFEDGRILIIGVADGHGSPNCFRSDFGSKAAIDVAFLQTKRFYTESVNNDDIPILIARTGITRLKYSIWSEWRKYVKNHWEKHHIVDDEIRYLSVEDKYRARFMSNDLEVVNRYLYTAYGTTLLLAVVIDSQLLLLQIGDGTCVVLQRDGKFIAPIPLEEKNFLNVTTSLCDGEEFNESILRHAIIKYDTDSPNWPVAVFLSSDGVDDCYPVLNNEDHLYRLYTIIIDNILSAGYDSTVSEIINDLLPGMTKNGSQDDISLAFLVCSSSSLLREAYRNIDEKFKYKDISKTQKYNGLELSSVIHDIPSIQLGGCITDQFSNPAKVDVIIKCQNELQNTEICLTTNDKGEFSGFLLPSDNYSAVIGSKGYLYRSLQLHRSLKDRMLYLNETIQKIDTSNPIVLLIISFYRSDSKLTPESEASLDTIAKTLLSYPDLRVELLVKTDCKDHKWWVGGHSQQVKSVLGYLTTKGISKKQIIIVSKNLAYKTIDNYIVHVEIKL